MKKLLVLIVASMASSLFLYALVSRDLPARHPELSVADLPPLISVHDLYAVTTDHPETTENQPKAETTRRVMTGLVGKIVTRLSLPRSIPNPKPLPAVVMITSKASGGVGADSDRTVLFLSNRGYVVLTIDCEEFASSYSIAVEHNQPLSSSCTASTIRDETLKLVDQGIADPAALAILGSGVGGYLALMTMSLEPGLFKAAIVHAAITDQANVASEDQAALKPQQAVAKTVVHPVDAIPNPIHRPGQSPIDLVGNIHGAVLITHGKADTVGPLDKVQTYAQQLLGAQKDVEIIYFDHEEHCYSRWQTRVQVARLTESFLARRLGGRNGGYDYIELLAKLF